jgi:Mg2+/Co2+ transporter CorB
VSRARIWHLAERGDRRARLVKRHFEDKERLISALLIGNNIVNILAAAIATEALLRLVGTGGVALATFVMTTLVVIFGEVLPKTYAIRHADTVAMRVAPAARLLVAALAPVTAVLRVLINGILRPFGTRLAGGGIAVGTEQLRGAIALAAAEGGVGKHYRDMLGAVLDLEEIEVSSVMTHRRHMVTVNADLPVAEIVALVRSQPYTRYPVWRGEPDTIVGILHTKDLFAAVLAAGGPEEVRLDAIMAPPWFVPDTTSLQAQLLAFRHRRAHLALVVDEYGTLQGLVTLEDIIEEIVGEIEDEKDHVVEGVRREADGTLIVEGHVGVRDLNRQFDWRLPDEEATTIAGLVINAARRIPDAGESFEAHGFRFDVLRRQRHQLTLLRITPPPSEPEVGEEGPGRLPA